MEVSLKEFYNLAYDAYRNTSFSPEKRAKTLITSYEELLNQKIENLKNNQVESGDIEWYKNRFISLFRTWLARKSNTFSVMITGGSNFPVRKHRKANESEHKASTQFHEWIDYSEKKLIRKLWKKPTNSEMIDSYYQQIEQRESLQERMKRLNKIYPKWLKQSQQNENFNPLVFAEQYALSPSELELLQEDKPRGNGRKVVFAQFSLTNNNANIKRLKESVQELLRREAKKEAEPLTFEFEGGSLVLNYEIERIQIFHDQKPSSDMITYLKKSAYKFSPTNKCWQRQLTENALFSARQMFPQLQLPRRAFS